MTYRIHDVPVNGGNLRVGDWGSDDPAAPAVLALHGITASHRAWAEIARELAGKVRLIAPDLRGRGRSARLPGPYGMASHVADLEGVIEALHLPPAILVGHSMGGFVAIAAAHLLPRRFRDVLLVDGGLPLAVPAGLSREGHLEATLGPAARRLSMTFPDRGTYLEFWRQHPAFAGDQWSEAVTDYAGYDLTGTEPELRASASWEAVREDSMDLYGGGVVQAALEDLLPGRPDDGRTFSLLTAPRGLLNETPGLYSPIDIECWRAKLPALKIREVPDVNHYTIVMGQAGARQVAREVLCLRKSRELHVGTRGWNSSLRSLM